MRGTKLLELLKSFDKQDWIDTTIYLKHALGKTSREAALYDYIKRYKRNLSSPKLEMSAMKEFVCPNVHMRSFYNILYKLTAHIELNVVFKDLSAPENHFEYKAMVARVYKKRRANELYSAEVKTIKKEAEQSKTIDIWKNTHVIRTYYEYYLSDATDEGLRKEDLFKDMVGVFEEFNNLLGLFCKTEILNLKRIRTKELSLELPFSVKNEEGIERTNTVKLMYYAKEAAKNKNEKNYIRLRSEFMMQKERLSTDIYFYLLIQLFNQINYLVKKGFAKHGIDALRLYDLGLNSGVLLKNKKLSENRFFNIVDLGCKLKEWDWIHQFRRKWSENVETNHYKEMISVADAFEFFVRGNYKQVFTTLAKIKSYKNTTLSLRAKCLLLCSHYEVYKDDEPTYQNIASFRSYLRRYKNQMNMSTLRGTENFITIVEMMIKHEKKEKIESYLNRIGFVVYRKWVDDKLKTR